MALPLKDCRVLIVDDQPSYRRALRTSLAASGITVEEREAGEDAIKAFNRARFDLVLLDINMPGIGGIETCRQLRAMAGDVGIVMVTVRGAEDDKVHALEAGADDFVTKPYRLRELLARLQAVLRRVRVHNAAPKSILQAGELELDLDHRVLRKRGEEVHLSPTEFDLMAYLFRNQGGPVTHVRLLRAVWGLEYGNELEYLRSYVRALRKKIEDDPAHPNYLLTEPCVGYRLCDPSADAGDVAVAQLRDKQGYSLPKLYPTLSEYWGTHLLPNRKKLFT
jgi:two-component system KDP operon response regulator KdpE